MRYVLAVTIGWTVGTMCVLALGRAAARPTPPMSRIDLIRSGHCAGCLEQLEFDDDGYNICVQCGGTTVVGRRS